MSEADAGLLHQGGCHCGRVRFRAQGPARLEVLDCNCSMCRMTGFLHWIVPAARFELLTPWSEIATYTFNTGIARHLFCRHCGIKSFYVPRSNPDVYDINVRCLDDEPRRSLCVTPFDGQQWEANGATLRHLSA